MLRACVLPRNFKSESSESLKAMAESNEPKPDDGIVPTLTIMLEIYEASLKQILCSSSELNGERSE